VKVIYSLC